jgi:hypothetical protein
MTKKTKVVGWESGKSSNKWFGGRQKRGWGASAGDGVTGSTVESDTDSWPVRGIKVIFRKANGERTQ